MNRLANALSSLFSSHPLIKNLSPKQKNLTIVASGYVNAVPLPPPAFVYFHVTNSHDKYGTPRKPVGGRFVSAHKVENILLPRRTNSVFLEAAGDVRPTELEFFAPLKELFGKKVGYDEMLRVVSDRAADFIDIFDKRQTIGNDFAFSLIEAGNTRHFSVGNRHSGEHVAQVDGQILIEWIVCNRSGGIAVKGMDVRATPKQPEFPKYQF